MQSKSRSGRKGLEGVRVGLLEARMSGELGELVRRHGGVPRCVPSVREAPVDCAAQVASFLDGLNDGTPAVVVFMTGAGVVALFREAENQGRLSSLQRSLRLATLVCRGPKPTAAIRKQGLSPALDVGEPFTSTELLQAMTSLTLDRTRVTIVHYGERSDALSDELRTRGAFVQDLVLYEWLLPEDPGPLQQFVRDTLGRQFDAVVFTSQIQCRHLFRVAAGIGLAAQLKEALNGEVVVAVIGPVCRATVEAFGVAQCIEPGHPKMGPLVASLADHFGGRA
jgi:uroporphyrinogen-III synthase